VIRFLLGRLGLLIVGLLIASLLIFLALRVLPGDIAQVIAGIDATPEQIAAIRERLGLDASPLSQYLDWLGGLLSLDLGRNLDDRELWTITSRWRDVGSYRRALGGFEGKAIVAPMLSRAIDEPTAFDDPTELDPIGYRGL